MLEDRLSIDLHVGRLFEGRDDFVGVCIFVLKFLMMTSALFGVSCFNEIGHGFIKFRLS